MIKLTRLGEGLHAKSFWPVTILVIFSVAALQLFSSALVLAEPVNPVATVAAEQSILEISLLDSNGSDFSDNMSMDVKLNQDGIGFNEKDVTISVSTNNKWGYNLTMNVANTDLTSTRGNKIPSLDNKNGGYTCSQATVLTCDFTVNSWGYKIKQATKTQQATNYVSIPRSINLNKSEKNINDDRTNLAFGSRVDVSQAPGTYSTTIKFMATVNPATDYVVEFNANGGNGTMAAQTIPYGVSTKLNTNTFTGATNHYVFDHWNTQEDDGGRSFSDGATVLDLVSSDISSITLYAQWNEICPAEYICYDVNGGTEITALADSSLASELTLEVPDYKRDGYGFLGWNTAADGNGTNYGPNETIDASNMGGTTLYAHWIASEGSLQGWSGCNSLSRVIYNTNGTFTVTDRSVTALTDTRDGNVYAVARLADGKCWMIESLRLSSTSNFSTASQGYAAGFTGLDVPETDGWTGDLDNLSNRTAGGKYVLTNASHADYRIPRQNTTNTDISHPLRTGNSRYLYGGYYTWAAAAASTESHTDYNWTTDTSICPRSWRLPYSSEYGTLDRAMGGNGEDQTEDAGIRQSAMWRMYPNNIVYSGFWRDSSANSQGSNGQYWSGESKSDENGYYLNITSVRQNSAFKGNYKYSGYAVRCVTP